ncbi:hypothetical protein [Methylobacter luteus]|jgi:hypothetical protein|uniref:hypothetical protein n=1 Tax=Methylobacter luteus TaxID=415 RepID=UPI0004084C7E|nr:hypothetical protein [Methylobacter luteus]
MPTQETDLALVSEEKKRCHNLIRLANLLLDRAIQSMSAARASNVSVRRNSLLIDRMSTEEIDILLNHILKEEEK